VIGFPDRLKTTLRYVQDISHAGSATPSAQVFAMNSLFDPDNSGTGHQPSFFDTFAGVYARYYVEAFKLEATIINESAIPVIYAIGYSDQAMTSNAVALLSESKFFEAGAVGPLTGLGVKNILLPWMTSQQLMGTPFTEADDNMYASTGASPNDVAWGTCRIAASDASTTITVRVRYKLTFRCVFKDLLPQVSS